VAVALSQAMTLYSNCGNYSALGQCWEKLGELEKAIAAYRQAIKLNPDAEEINFCLAETLQQQAKLYLEKAALAYRRAIELNPEQIESYQKLLEIEPENGDSWFSLGKVLEKKCDVDSAVKAYGGLVS
jgi:cytochrome c-type biogenesis protein CcmH/NrfG